MCSAFIRQSRVFCFAGVTSAHIYTEVWLADSAARVGATEPARLWGDGSEPAMTYRSS